MLGFMAGFKVFKMILRGLEVQYSIQQHLMGPQVSYKASFIFLIFMALLEVLAFMKLLTTGEMI